MSDYVSLLINFTKDYESPTSFWRWSAYSTVASVLRSKVYLEHKISKIHPNSYTVLLADSARFRKDHPLDVALELLTEVNCTKMFTGTASIQGILDKLSQATPNTKKGAPITGGSCIVLAKELSSFFVDDPRLIPLLTDLHGYRKEFPYDLRGGSITIKDVCLSMLAASNEVLLREVYTQRATYGGLLRRTLLVTPDEVRPGNSLFDPDIPMDTVMAANQKAELIRVLDEISKLNGPMSMDYAAAKLYNNWYLELNRNYDKYGSRTGVVEGIHTLILKTAIAKTAAKVTMTIDLKTIEESILEVTALKPNYEVYAMQSGGSDKSKIATIIIANLWKAVPKYSLRKQDILMKHWNDMTSLEFDEAIETLKAGGLITQHVNGTGDLHFVLTQAALDKLEAKMNKP